ncbi:MAG: single-stranded DNA-binding protein [Nocardioidaceae bacterium]
MSGPASAPAAMLVAEVVTMTKAVAKQPQEPDSNPNPNPGPDPGREPEAEGVNRVELTGRVTSPPLARELPSGDVIVTFRMSVPRADAPPAAAGGRARQTSDWVDCVAWSGRQRRTTGSWRVGDRVRVEGALRRRFYRAGSETATRLEVEVLAGQRVARAAPD